jgi:hypothetical protein
MFARHVQNNNNLFPPKGGMRRGGLEFEFEFEFPLHFFCNPIADY